MLSRLYTVALAVAAAVLAMPAARAQEVRVVEMTIQPGLKFDPPRFAVKPGEPVKLKLTNPDQMIHNLVITKVGGRTEVVNAAMALGAAGPAQNFIPPSPLVLHHTRALNPGESETLTFTAPAEEGVYPYVCTFMGHGFVMYGAMYVTTAPLPPLAKDTHVPPTLISGLSAAEPAKKLDRPMIARTFLPDCGPAALAIGFPNEQSVCFDAGTCEVRYAWRGGFVDSQEHWYGKGEAMSRPVGRVYYRAPRTPQLRLGSLEPVKKWRGYRWTRGQPVLEWTLNGAPVRLTLAPLEKGSGLLWHYAVEMPAGETLALHFEAEAGAKFTCPVGEWQGGTLRLTAEQARDFTLAMTERAGVEPAVYWSMNDLPLPNKKDPQPGVVGRAFTPGGTDGKPRPLAAGIETGALEHGGTLMAWVKLDIPKEGAPSLRPDLQPVFSAGEGEDAMLITAPTAQFGWHHLAVTWAHGGEGKAYLDGVPVAEPAPKLPAKSAPILLGSAGTKYLPGLLDEVRIYDRALTAAEIAAVVAKEQPSAKK